MELKNKLEEYTEAEFISFLEEFFENIHNLSGDDFEKQTIKFAHHFETITEHPRKSGVIFYPEEDQEDSPEGILKEVKKWRAQNGKPGFKAP
jgi:hypothetical protein